MRTYTIQVLAAVALLTGSPGPVNSASYHDYPEYWGDRPARPVYPDYRKRVFIEQARSRAGYQVKIHLAGWKPEDVRIDRNRRSLRIAVGSAYERQRHNDRGSVIRYRSRGSLSRTLTLPRDADLSAMTHRFDNGVVTLEIPRIPFRRW